MKPQPAVFTRDNPCTKLDLWNAFRGRRGFVKRQVDEAKAVIGVNAPRVMVKNGYLHEIRDRDADYFRLTSDGEKWLKKGMENFLKNHPDRVSDAVNLPKAMKNA